MWKPLERLADRIGKKLFAKMDERFEHSLKQHNAEIHDIWAEHRSYLRESKQKLAEALSEFDLNGMPLHADKLPDLPSEKIEAELSAVRSRLDATRQEFDQGHGSEWLVTQFDRLARAERILSSELDSRQPPEPKLTLEERIRLVVHNVDPVDRLRERAKQASKPKERELEI